MNPFMGSKKVKVSRSLLDNVHFDGISPTGLEILKGSKSFYKSWLLDQSPESFQHAAYGLAKSRFRVK